jgi:hypothetical protein
MSLIFCSYLTCTLDTAYYLWKIVSFEINLEIKHYKLIVQLIN